MIAFLSKRVLGLAAALALFAAVIPGAADATTATGTLTVTATVAAKCTVSAPTLAFGTYDPIVTNASAVLDGTSTATFTCTKGSSGVYVQATTGSNPTHASGSCAVATCTRAMSDGGTNYLSYDLYTDSGHTHVWSPSATSGVTVFNPTFASSHTATATIYGEIPGGIDAVVASYTDSVTMTINF